MRRKKITVSVNELPEEIKTGVIEYIEKKNGNMDNSTLMIVGLEQHIYTPKCHIDFIKRLKKYVHINGNRIVCKKELAAIGGISRPTIDKMIDNGVILSEYGFKLRDYFEREKRYKELVKNGFNISDAYESCGLSFSYPYAEFELRNTFDLQKIIDLF